MNILLLGLRVTDEPIESEGSCTLNAEALPSLLLDQPKRTRMVC